jgi:hypothetical protein
MSGRKALEMKHIKVGHFCPDWDYTWIEPDTSEFECCLCEEHLDCLECRTKHD